MASAGESDSVDYHISWRASCHRLHVRLEGSGDYELKVFIELILFGHINCFPEQFASSNTTSFSFSLL